MADLLEDSKLLTLEGAKLVGAAAEAEARGNGWNVAIAIVDAGCHPLYVIRMPRALLASYEGALNKAMTAVMFDRPTKALEESVANGRLHYLTFRNVLPVDGGIPIRVDGRIVGGIGVGGTPSGREGSQCADAGIAALMAKCG